MPIWLRKFTFSKIQEHYQNQKEETDKLNNQTKQTNKHKNPNFITKASK